MVPSVVNVVPIPRGAKSIRLPSGNEMCSVSPFNLTAVATIPSVVIEDRCDLKKWVVVLLDQ